MPTPDVVLQPELLKSRPHRANVAEAVDEFFYLRRDMPVAEVRKGIAHVGRTHQIERIVALDDFDVELAAGLREYLRVPGMGETTARAFRDKLTMRSRARAARPRTASRLK